jgi:hypothetical protein
MEQKPCNDAGSYYKVANPIIVAELAELIDQYNTQTTMGIKSPHYGMSIIMLRPVQVRVRSLELMQIEIVISSIPSHLTSWSSSIRGDGRSSLLIESCIL